MGREPLGLGDRLPETGGGAVKVYLAGPMTGLPDDNLPAFHEGAARLRALGYEVVSPAETDGEPQSSRTWADWMRRDIALLLVCDGVACLPGWEASRGATLETDIARGLGMPIICAETLEAFAAARRGVGLGPTLEQTLAEVMAWADATFPHATPESKAAHLLREAHELRDNPRDPEEIADVVILAAGAAHLSGVDLHQAIRAKLAKLRTRRWGPIGPDGVVEHVREGEEAAHG